MKQKGLFLILLLSTIMFTYASPRNNELGYFDKDSIRTPTILKLQNLTALDSLYERRQDGTLILDTPIDSVALMSNLTFRDTLIVNPLYLPMVFNGKILPSNLSLYSEKDANSVYRGVLLPKENTFESEIAKYNFVSSIRLDYYRNYPDRIKISSLDFDELPAVAKDSEVLDTFNPFKELISTETSFSLDAPTVDGATIKRKYWVKSGNHSLHFSQSYFSPNWSSGGTGVFTLLNNHVLKVNYQKKRIKFNNTLELRLSTVTSPDDSLRSYRITDDLLRYTADFGVDAFGKHWSYSTNVDARTQLFNNHPVNSKEVQSAFLAPAYVSGGIGLKYNLDKTSSSVRHRRIKLSFNFDPASFSYRYVGNNKVDVTRYGIEEGKKSKYDWGSTVTGNLIFNYNKYIELNTRMRYFTSYQKVEAELENTLNMALTNAFSTRIFLHLKFDDKVPKDSKYGYLQLNELLSFGLNYKW